MNELHSLTVPRPTNESKTTSVPTLMNKPIVATVTYRVSESNP